MASSTSYRSQPAQQSSDSESSGSDDDQPWKRQKQSKGAAAVESPMIVAPPKEPSLPSHFPPSSKGGFKRKRNNVWGEIVQKQEEEQVARDINQFDIEHSKERDVESYSFKDNNATQQVHLGNPISFEENVSHQHRRRMPDALGGSYEDAWLKDESDSDENSMSVKDRLGSRNDIQKAKDRLEYGEHEELQRCYDTDMRFLKITPEMHRREVAGKLAFSLQEPKRDMVKTVVYELGVEKALELWEQTSDIEKSGGLMVNNGSRRRTPGGVFFHLIKTNDDIPKEKKNTIFASTLYEGKQESKKKRRKNRQRTRMKMKVEQEEKDDANNVGEGGLSDENISKEWEDDGFIADVNEEVSSEDKKAAISADGDAALPALVKNEEAEMEEGEVSD